MISAKEEIKPVASNVNGQLTIDVGEPTGHSPCHSSSSNALLLSVDQRLAALHDTTISTPRYFDCYHYSNYQPSDCTSLPTERSDSKQTSSYYPASALTKSNEAEMAGAVVEPTGNIMGALGPASMSYHSDKPPSLSSTSASYPWGGVSASSYDEWLASLQQQYQALGKVSYLINSAVLLMVPGIDFGLGYGRYSYYNHNNAKCRNLNLIRGSSVRFGNNLVIRS